MRYCFGFGCRIGSLQSITNSNASDIFSMKTPVFIGIHMVLNYEKIGECHRQTFPLF